MNVAELTIVIEALEQWLDWNASPDANDERTKAAEAALEQAVAMLEAQLNRN